MSDRDRISSKKQIMDAELYEAGIFVQDYSLYFVKQLNDILPMVRSIPRIAPFAKRKQQQKKKRQLGALLYKTGEDDEDDAHTHQEAAKDGGEEGYEEEIRRMLILGQTHSMFAAF